MTARLPALLFLTAAACAPRPAEEGAPSPGPDVVVAARPDSTLVTLERTPCFGACPVYTVSISGAGSVRFVGTRFTTRLGVATAEIPPGRVDSLVEELRQGGYFEFADAYVADAPGCGRYATDSPTVITSVVAGGARKEIRHDYGCGDAPPGLGALEKRIDEVAGTGRWTGR
jgi:hypothetical protein